MTEEDLTDIVHIIRFRLTPDQRRELPAGVANWLLPTAITQDRIAAETAQARRR